MLLESIGADTFVHSHFSPYGTQGLILARVSATQRDRYQLLCSSGIVEAEASGSLWYRTPDKAGMPATGDWVAARLADSSFAIIEAVLPRKTFFSRRAAGRREEEQAVAANIDLVFLVCGLDSDFNLRRLERYLALTAEAGAEAVVVLNKRDLCLDLDARIAETLVVARGIPIVPATTKEAGGLDAVRAFLGEGAKVGKPGESGKTVALLGSSGVGKLAIVNCLLGEDRMSVGPTRASDGRGRHTTTQRELIPLPGGGALIDTPGMRELQLWAGQESVDRSFDEIADLATRCRFRDCRHGGEIGCAVAQALSEGVVSQERWQSYRKLQAEVKRHEESTNPLAAAERKKREKAIHRNARDLLRKRDV